MGKISVIVPNFNKGEYLSRCLNSIVSQSHKDIELIIIDDASADNSRNIIDFYSKNDNRIKPIYLKNNMGVSNARNIGLDNVTGDFVMFVDSDDFLDHNEMEKLHNISLDYNADVVETTRVFHYITKKGKLLSFTESKLPKEVVVKGSFYENSGLKNELRYIHGILYKKDVLGDVRFNTDIKCYEDGVYNHTIRPNIKKYVISPTCGYHYVQVPNSLSRGKVNERHLDYIKTGSEIKRLYDENNYFGLDIEKGINGIITGNIMVILLMKLSKFDASQKTKLEYAKEFVNAMRELKSNKTNLKNSKESIKDKILVNVCLRMWLKLTKNIDLEGLYFKIQSKANKIKVSDDVQEMVLTKK